MLKHLPIFVFALLLPACGNVYNTAFRYKPRPIEIPMVAADAPNSPRIRALATIVGLRYATADHPARMEIRLRLENVSDQPATFNPASLSLFDASIKPLPEPTATPAETTIIAPQQSQTIDAMFPVSDLGAYDLEGLNLRWAVTVNNTKLTHSATFQRQPRDDPHYYHRPYYDPHYDYGRYPYPRYRYRYW